MRIVSAAAFSLLCACAAPQGPSDGQQTSGSTSDVALRAEPATIASGGSMTLTLDNESGGTIGYNLCASGLEQRSGGGWQPLPENRVCTVELRTLEPGDEVSEQLRLPEMLTSGDYRYTTTIERLERRGRERIASSQFRIG